MRDRSPTDLMLWFVAAIIFVAMLTGPGCHLTPGGRAVEKWYRDQWDRDGACLDWCSVELGLDKSFILAMSCQEKDCQRKCVCRLLGRSL